MTNLNQFGKPKACAVPRPREDVWCCSACGTPTDTPVSRRPPKRCSDRKRCGKMFHPTGAMKIYCAYCGSYGNFKAALHDALTDTKLCGKRCRDAIQKELARTFSIPKETNGDESKIGLTSECTSDCKKVQHSPDCDSDSC